MSSVCPNCGVVVSNVRKHKRRNRCVKQHIRKNIRDVLKQTKGYEHFPIPRPPPSHPDDLEEDEEEEDLIPTYKGEESEDS